jgi:hypothetical protein
MPVIYILQDGNNLNTDIYKIGKTTCINSRLSQYSKNTVLHKKYNVEENILDNMEKIIINRFSKKFIIEKGREWFKGNIIEMISEIDLIINSYKESGVEDSKDNMENICNFCSKQFTTKVNLLQHQRTVKSCLILQGKQEETSVECINCKKVLSLKYYKQHKIKCDLLLDEKKKHEENIEKTKLYSQVQEKYKNLEKENKKLKSLMEKYNTDLKERDLSIEKFKSDIIYLEKEKEKLKYANDNLKSLNELLEKQNEKLQSISTSVTMKLAEKVNNTFLEDFKE